MKTSDRAWDTARVKSELPNVPVNLDGKIVTGIVRGRLLTFAHVHVGDHVDSPGPYRGFCEVTWSSLARVLNRIDAGEQSAAIQF